MLPWNYGFHWSGGTLIFLGAFYTVLVVVATMLVFAALRSRRALAARKAEQIRWHSDFHDLPAADRVCRHVLTGEFQSRECPHAFDCRECETHARLIGQHPMANPAQPERRLAPSLTGAGSSRTKEAGDLTRSPGDRGGSPEESRVEATVGGELSGESEEDIFGMSFPLDRLYHRGHTWAHPEEDGTATIGLDDLGKRLLGAPDSVRLPQPGARIEANGTAFEVRKRDAAIAVLSPVDGEVVETGGPDSDWYLRVKPEVDGEPAYRHLLRGAEIRPWLLREMERLQLALTAEGAAPTLADGGVPVADIAAAYPEADWDAVCGEMFLRP